MKLWLLRHGEAEPHASRDSERRLTAHGRKEVLQSAARLAGLPLDGILASPYVRAQQTAELVREALGLVEPVGTAPWLTPDDDPREVLGFLDERSERNLLLVSHQPLVGALGGLLVHGNRRDPLPMSTASLAELEGDFGLAASPAARLGSAWHNDYKPKHFPACLRLAVMEYSTKQVLGRSPRTTTTEAVRGHCKSSAARSLLRARKASSATALPGAAHRWRPGRGAELGRGGRPGAACSRLVAQPGSPRRQPYRDHLEELCALDRH